VVLRVSHPPEVPIASHPSISGRSDLLDQHHWLRARAPAILPHFTSVLGAAVVIIPDPKMTMAVTEIFGIVYFTQEGFIILEYGYSTNNPVLDFSMCDGCVGGIRVAQTSTA
jgi:hypothetical protein